MQTSSNRSTNINFYEVSSDGNIPSIVNNFEDIGPKFIFSVKVGKPDIRMENQEKGGKKWGQEEKKKVKGSWNIPVVLKLEHALESPGVLLKHMSLGSISSVSDSEGLGWTSQCAVLTSSQVMLMLLGQVPYFEN